MLKTILCTPGRNAGDAVYLFLTSFVIYYTIGIMTTALLYDTIQSSKRDERSQNDVPVPEHGHKHTRSRKQNDHCFAVPIWNAIKYHRGKDRLLRE